MKSDFLRVLPYVEEISICMCPTVFRLLIEELLILHIFLSVANGQNIIKELWIPWV
jgi:hypothetical protein